MDEESLSAVSVVDVERFRAEGFVALREVFDPSLLIAEVGEAFAVGFPGRRGNNVSAEAGIAFRYLPMMSERTPVSLELLRRFAPVAERLLGTPVLPVRTKAVEYHGASSWHRDTELDVATVGFVCYLEPLTAEQGALRVVPGSHRDLDALGAETAETAETVGTAVETNPGDVIVFDEHLLHASRGGGVRHQWRVDYIAWPTSAAEHATVREYYAAIFSPEWDGGYDVDAYATYGPYWRQACTRAVDAALEAVGAYAAADEEEDAARRRRASVEPTS